MKGEGHVTKKAEIKVLRPSQGLLANTRSQEEAKKDPPLQRSEGVWPC